MNLKRLVSMALGLAGATVVLLHGQGQAPTPAPRQGPGVQGPQDARYAGVIAACKNPPAGRGAGAAAAPRGQQQGGGAPAAAGAAAPARGNAAPAGVREYTVTEIPGVIAAGQQWRMVWQTPGNNADGIVGTDDGLLIAQNDNSAVVKLDRNGNTSVVYRDTNTGGALSMNAKGALFVAQRALNPAIWQIVPERKLLANRYQDDPLDCIGGVLNDLTADSKGGVYFTMGGLFYANPRGVVTQYGQNLRTNGVILSGDEKTLYVTNGGTLAAFDVQADGSLTNQREFVALQGGGGGDGLTVDSANRIYVTGGPGVHVISPEGKYIGLIPTPRGVITAAFGGPDKKTLYAVASIRDGGTQSAEVFSIQLVAQGFRGRAK